EALLQGTLHGGLTGGFREGAIAQTVQPIDLAGASKGDERHLFAIARFKTHRRPGRNVEVLAKRQPARKDERLVDLEEVHMRSHLDRTIAVIRHLNLAGLPPHIGLDRLGPQDIFPWNHILSSYSLSPRERVRVRVPQGEGPRVTATDHVPSPAWCH